MKTGGTYWDMFCMVYGNACDRILHDQSSVAGLHSQALDTLQEKLNEAEASLRLETEQHRKTKVCAFFLCLMQQI